MKLLLLLHISRHIRNKKNWNLRWKMMVLLGFSMSISSCREMPKSKTPASKPALASPIPSLEPLSAPSPPSTSETPKTPTVGPSYPFPAGPSKKRKTPRIARKPSGPWEQTHTIRPGDTLESIMEHLRIKPHRLQIDIRDELADFLDLRKIRPGHKIFVRFHRNGRLDWLRYFKDPINEWKIDVCWRSQPCYQEYDAPQHKDRSSNWIVETQKVAIQERIVQDPVQIQITRHTPNLTAALVAQRQQGSLTPPLAQVLGNQVNLNRLYGGEKFNLVVERLRYQDKYYGYRNILFARFQRNNQPPLTWLYYSPRSAKEVGHYYRPDGSRQGKQQMFAVPIQPFQPGTRRFGMRFHPILRRYRMHWGVDFSAPCGRRLYAVQDGHIITRGWRGGAGRMISIRHDNGWVSRYMHLSRYAVQRGSRVKRGQLIGYVGTTGLSTGCHLHFELMRWGRHLDPLKVLKLQEQYTIPCQQMKSFWRFHTQACRSTGLSLQQCQLQLPARCFRAHRRTFWRTVLHTYGTHIGFSMPRKPGIWPTLADKQLHRRSSSPSKRKTYRQRKYRKKRKTYRQRKYRKKRKTYRQRKYRKKRKTYRQRRQRPIRKPAGV